MFLGQFCRPAFVFGHDIFKLWGKWCFIELNNILALCYNAFAIDFNPFSPNSDQCQISPNYTSARSKRTGKENEWTDQH